MTGPCKGWVAAIVLGLTVPWSGAWGQGEAKLPPPPRPLAGVENDLGVAYLPDRLRGGFEDRWVKMNVHWHKDGPPRPCVVFVHGGGYGGGDMDGGFRGAGGPDRKTMELFARNGFAVVNLNYILGEGLGPQIFPQVFWDFKAAVRFLRLHAGKYNLDPCRFGAVGFSAGGWLISTSCFPEAGDWLTRTRRFAPADADVLGTGDRFAAKDHLLLTNLDDPRPAYERYSARVQAVSFDFFQHHDRMTPAAPATQVWLGAGGTSKIEAFCRSAGVDYRPALLTGERFRGKDVLHVPPMDAPARTPTDASEKELRLRLLEFFDRQLRQDPRTPAVEFRPTRPVFADRVRVEMLVPAPDIAIRYTADGSMPTEKSPIYREPLTLTETTTVRALAFRKGERLSGIASARYLRGEAPPAIEGPKDLPPAKVGRPYAVRFATPEKGPVVWSVSGHVTPGKPRNPKKGPQPLGLSVDAATGELAGTPTRPGIFTFQIQCARGWGRPAETRTYVLRVE